MPKISFSLVPFSPSPMTSLDFKVDLQFSPTQIQFVFQLRGDKSDIARLTWPSTTTPSRRDGLWQTTVFELFVGKKGEAGYVEFNFSPSGDWNAYRFTSERQGMKEVPELKVTPVTKINKANDLCEVHGAIDLELLDMTGPLELSATSVLDFGDHKEYWALVHMGEKPDFHLRTSFVANSTEY